MHALIDSKKLVKPDSIRIVYTYIAEDDLFQRSFTLQEIREGADKNYACLIPGYKFIGCEVEVSE
jgi:hypothetical protein